jgi:amino acid permease
MLRDVPWLQWLVASIFIFCVGLSLAELGSAAPTSGGVSLTTIPSSRLFTYLGYSCISGLIHWHHRGQGTSYRGSLDVSSA